MTEDLGSLIYLLILLVLVASSLLARRLPIGQMLRMMIAWVAIFGSVFVLFTFRSDFQRLWDRLRAEIQSPSAGRAANGSWHVTKAADGHFWVDAMVNGRATRFMVDSGATTTSLSAQDAADLGVETGLGFPVVVSTANGLAEMERARISTLTIGPIERRDLPVLVSDQLGDTNLLGMNFLSSLKGWRIEGDQLILTP